MSNLAALQRRTESCEAAVTLARLALNDKRLETFGSPLSVSNDKDNSTQLELASTPRSVRRGNSTTFEKLGSKYYYVEKDQKVKWHVALQKCHEMGGHLANVRHQEDLDTIKEKLVLNARYWIDITDQFQEGKYISMTNGSEASFLKWDNTEPTNDGDCVDVIAYNGKVAMNDNSCSKELYFICETSASF